MKSPLLAEFYFYFPGETQLFETYLQADLTDFVQMAAIFISGMSVIA